MKQYIKPVTEIIAARIHAVLEGTSKPEKGNDFDAWGKENFDDIEESNGWGGEQAHIHSFSAWDE